MDAFKLLSLVEQNPAVFDVGNDNFKNREYKLKIWNEIGEQLGTTGLASKKEWMKIRNRYLTLRSRRSLNKIPHRHIQKWKLLGPMNFYIKYLAQKPKPPKKNFPQPMRLKTIELKIITKPAQSNTATEDQQSFRVGQQISINENQQISFNDNTEEILKSFDESSEDEDGHIPNEEDDVLKTFFDAMLETVNGFSDRSQHKVKTKIFSIVAELEQKELDLKALMKT